MLTAFALPMLAFLGLSSGRVSQLNQGLTTIVSFVFVLGVLVLFHELGHFWVAKRFGVRVLKFSIGMGPRLAGFRRGETEYLLSWVPFGGYVKMAGEDPDEEKSGDPGEFASKGPWVRAAILAAGPAMNYLLAVVIFSAYFLVNGVETIATRSIGRVEPGSPAEAAGFIAGDEVLTVDGAPVKDWREFTTRFASAGEGIAKVQVTRGGAAVEIPVDVGALKKSNTDLGLLPYASTEIGEVQREGPAWRAGLRRGDRIVSIGGQPVSQWSEVASLVHTKADVPLEVVWDRRGAKMSATVTPEQGDVPRSETETEKMGLIRIGQKFDRERLAPWSAVALGVERTVYVTGEVFRFFGALVSRRVSVEMVGGPIRIGQIAGESARWGANVLVLLIATLSVNLAVLNLVPIPILDGGQLFVIFVESIMRRPLSLKQRLLLQQIGLVVIILLMVTVTTVDIRRLFR